MTLEEKAKSEWLANSVWLICNGIKHDYYDYCKRHDLQDDNSISLQLFKNLYDKIQAELNEMLKSILLAEDEF